MAAPPDQPADGHGLLRSTVTLLAARLSSNSGFFVAVLLIARSLGPAQRGSFAFVSVGGLLLGTLASLGVGSALAVIAAQHPSRRPELVSTGAAWGAVTGAVAGGLLVGAGAVLGTGALPAGVDLATLGWVAVVTVVMSTGEVVASIHQGSRLFAPAAMVTGSAPWVYCGILLVAALTGSLDLELAVCAWVAFWIVWAIGILLVAHRFIGFGPLRPATIAESLSFGLRAWIGSTSSRLNDRADQVLMGFIATETTLGIYAVAVNLSEVLLYIPSVVGFVLLPAIARSAASDRTAMTLLTARRLLVVAAVTAVIAAILGPVLLPLLFGAAYRGSVTPFLILIPGSLGFVLISTFSNALTASGAPGWSSSGPLAALVTGLGLDLLLIPPYGASGAAIAAAIAFLVGGVVAVVGYRSVDRFPLTALMPRPADVAALGRVGRSLLFRDGAA